MSSLKIGKSNTRSTGARAHPSVHLSVPLLVLLASRTVRKREGCAVSLDYFSFSQDRETEKEKVGNHGPSSVESVSLRPVNFLSVIPRRPRCRRWFSDSPVSSLSSLTWCESRLIVRADATPGISRTHNITHTAGFVLVLLAEMLRSLFS